MNKICKTCELDLPIEMFGKYYKQCKKCTNKKYNDANKEKGYFVLKYAEQKIERIKHQSMLYHQIYKPAKKLSMKEKGITSKNSGRPRKYQLIESEILTL